MSRRTSSHTRSWAAVSFQGQAAQSAAPAHPLGEPLPHLGGERVDEPPHERAERALGQSLGERVDRHETARVQPFVLAVLDDLVVWLLDDHRALVASHASVQDEPLAALEDARQVAPAEPAGGGVAARVTEHHGERHPRAAGRRRAHADGDPRARCGLPGYERMERSHARTILVAEGHEEERVLDGAEALALELAGALRAGALDKLQRPLEVGG